MAPPLQPELWSQIFFYLYRPLPKFQGEEQWADLHQNDLASVMRVNSYLHDIAAPLLYGTTAITDLPKLFIGIEYVPEANSTFGPKRLGKRDLLHLIRKLVLLHPVLEYKVGLFDPFEPTPYDPAPILSDLSSLLDRLGDYTATGALGEALLPKLHSLIVTGSPYNGWDCPPGEMSGRVPRHVASQAAEIGSEVLSVLFRNSDIRASCQWVNRGPFVALGSTEGRSYLDLPAPHRPSWVMAHNGTSGSLRLADGLTVDVAQDPLCKVKQGQSITRLSDVITYLASITDKAYAETQKAQRQRDRKVAVKLLLGNGLIRPLRHSGQSEGDEGVSSVEEEEVRVWCQTRLKTLLREDIRERVSLEYASEPIICQACGQKTGEEWRIDLVWT